MPGPNTPALTLRDIMTRVKSKTTLPAQKRRELCSAVATFCKICGQHASEVIADPGTIRKLGATAPWLLAGYSKKSWANTMSRLRRALELVGVKVHRQRRNFALTPEWSELTSGLCKRDHDELRRFAGWCSTMGVVPAGVSPQVFAQFYGYLDDQMTQQNPRERGHVARRAWNRVVVSSQGFQPVPAPEIASPRAMRWEDFPISLQQEVAAYREKVSATLVLDDNHHPLKPVTVENYLTRIRILLTALVEGGLPAESFQSLRDVVDPGMVKRGLQHRQRGRALDDKARMDLHSIATAVLSISRTIGVDETARGQLKVLAKKVRFTATGMNEKNKQRLSPLLTPAVEKALLDLPLKAVNEVGIPEHPSVRQAQRVQIAVLVELLLNVPLRIRNAAELVLGETISPPPSGIKGRWRISIPADDVKNGVAIDASLGKELSELLDRYVSVFRPVLLAQSDRHLFVSQSGLAKGSPALSKQFSAFIRRELGVTVHVHLMRHFAAHVFLIEHPGQYEVVRRLLGHKNINTTIRLYAGLEDAAAFERYDQLIQRIRGHGGDLL